jgi:hypothetical protein
MSGGNLEITLVLGFEEKHVWIDFCKNIICQYGFWPHPLRCIVLHMDEFYFIHRIKHLRILELLELTDFY